MPLVERIRRYLFDLDQDVRASAAAAAIPGRWGEDGYDHEGADLRDLLEDALKALEAKS